MPPAPPARSLPFFSRKLWVSDLSRRVWEGKCVQYAEYWRQIEWLSVVQGIRPCAVFLVSQQELSGMALVLQSFGIKTVSLSGRVGTEGKQKILLFRVAVGRPADLRAFRRAWKAGNHEEMGQLLGYPACCRTFYQEVFIDQGATDATWPMGLRTTNGAPEAPALETPGLPELNPFWIPAGVRMVPHHPCRFDCPASQALAQKFSAAGRAAGYSRAVKNALEILSWPVEWSALHGIAEIKTPVLKMSQRTDVTLRKRTLRLLGTAYPQEGAKALLSVLRLAKPVPPAVPAPVPGPRQPAGIHPA